MGIWQYSPDLMGSSAQNYPILNEVPQQLVSVAFIEISDAFHWSFIYLFYLFTILMKFVFLLRPVEKRQFWLGQRQRAIGHWVEGQWFKISYRADSRFAPSQWETPLLCNDVSHWLGTSLESAPSYWGGGVLSLFLSWVFRINEALIT